LIFGENLTSIAPFAKGLRL